MSEVIEIERLIEQRGSLERRVLQSQKIEAIRQLVGCVVHDLKVLMAIVTSKLAQISEQTPYRPECDEQFNTYEGIAEQIVALARSVKLIQSDLILRPVVFDPGDVVDSLLESIGTSLGRGIQIEVQRSAQIWACKADPAQMQNALLNLLVNARDAMPSGGQITISMRNERPHVNALEATPREYVVLSVTDTGKGMSREISERACEPFFTTKPPGEGSGLGLTAVQSYLARSNGRLVIESDVGLGTSIHMYLPRGHTHA